jgi:C-terminal processing protease CtpA/Prc
MAPPGPFTYSPGGIDVTLPSRDAIEVPVVRVVPPGSIAGFRLTPMKLPLTVQAIDAGGPAATSGLQIGDLLRSIDGESVDGLIPMSAMVRMFNHPEGKPLKLTVERAGAIIPIEIIPAHNGPTAP